MLRQYLRPLASLAVLAGLGAYATITIRGPQGLRAWQEKNAQIRALQEQNAQLERDNQLQRERIAKLQNDPATQELELKKLGLVHPNDTQFQITGQHLTPSAHQAR